MFKKILLFAVMVLLTAGVCFADSKFDILTLFSSESNADNKLWTGTFQLAFNDMRNNIIKHDIWFKKSKKTNELKGLNAGLFNKSMLNEDIYYTSVGETTPEAKEKIKNDIKEKFNETPDILDGLDWTKGIGKYYAYAMLKKDFEFLNEFDKLKNSKFNSKGSYAYFGITKNSNDELDDNLNVLFYNDANDYAVRLYTKNDDIVYLYRTEDNKSFDKLYRKMQKQNMEYKGNRFFDPNDTLKIPNIKIKDEKKYPELCNKTIKGTNLEFSDAIETIQFELNNKGGKVKSEAAIMTRFSATRPVHNKTRHFNFDKTFVIFLIDKDKTDPYFALRIKDLKGLN